MRFRWFSLATGVLVFSSLVLMAGRCWAVWYDLGPSRNEWGLKYEAKVDAASGDKLNVHFTLADQGRLKPIHSVFVMAFSNPDRSGTNLVKSPIGMKPTEEGKLAGQVVVGKQFANRAVIRIFTYTIDGRPQTAGPMAGARYYDIPLRKFLEKAPSTAPQSQPSIGSPPAANVTK
jgi:hypothetical protein